MTFSHLADESPGVTIVARPPHSHSSVAQARTAADKGTHGDITDPCRKYDVELGDGMTIGGASFVREQADSRGAAGAVCAGAGPGWVVRSVLRDPCRAGDCDLWVVVLRALEDTVGELWMLAVLHTPCPGGVWETQSADARDEAVARALKHAETGASTCDLLDSLLLQGWTRSATTAYVGRGACLGHPDLRDMAVDALCGLDGPDGDAVAMLAGLRGLETGSRVNAFNAGGQARVYDVAGAVSTWSEHVTARHLALVEKRHRPGRTPVAASTVVGTLARERDAALLLDTELLRSATYLAGGISASLVADAVDRWFKSCHPPMKLNSRACACVELLNGRRRLAPTARQTPRTSERWP